MNPILETRLMKCDSISDFLTMFFGLSLEEKLSVLGDDFIVSKGTKLYRIRKDDKITDFSKPEAWLPPPKNIARQGRFNANKSPILYVASEYYWLEREVSLQKGDVYYLATYVCEKDFSVGTLLNGNSQVCRVLHCVAKAIENTNCLTEKELFYLKQRVTSKLTPKDCMFNGRSSFEINNYVKDIYYQTNKIGQLVLRKNSNGIRYCSAYDPLETIGNGKIYTLDGEQSANFALTSEGINNISFLSVDKKVCTLEHTLEVFFKIINE